MAVVSRLSAPLQGSTTPRFRGHELKACRRNEAGKRGRAIRVLARTRRMIQDGAWLNAAANVAGRHRLGIGCGLGGMTVADAIWA